MLDANITIITTVSAAGDSITYRQWADLIKANFEKHFWVDTNPSTPDARRDLINRRGIYKDTVGATAPWTDYQLRCNFPIALAVVCDRLSHAVYYLHQPSTLCFTQCVSVCLFVPSRNFMKWKFRLVGWSVSAGKAKAKTFIEFWKSFAYVYRFGISWVYTRFVSLAWSVIDNVQDVLTTDSVDCVRSLPASSRSLVAGETVSDMECGRRFRCFLRRTDLSQYLKHSV